MHPCARIVLAAVAALAIASTAHAAKTPGPPEVGWTTIQGTEPMVRFQLHWKNEDPQEPTDPITGEVHSQPFGAFAPDAGLIGAFEVPAIQAQSFFDVFIDVPLASLPQTFEMMRTGPLGPFTKRTFDDPTSCSPTDHWDGNVDIIWMGPTGGMSQVNYHFGDIKVCPGSGTSYIHMIVGCEQESSWQIANACPDWGATLINEDFTPAPTVLPALWTGYIAMTASASVPIGALCCVYAYFTCGTQATTVTVCASACQCVTSTEPSTWGAIKSLYR